MTESVKKKYLIAHLLQNHQDFLYARLTWTTDLSPLTFADLILQTPLCPEIKKTVRSHSPTSHSFFTLLTIL